MSSKRVIILDSSESLILNKSLNDLKSLNLLKLKHPKSNEQNYFILIETDTHEYDLFELLNYNFELGSLFIDNYVQSDALVYLASKFNLNYFLISLLYNQTNDVYMSLSELKKKLLEVNQIGKDTKEAEIIQHKLVFNQDCFEKLFDVENKDSDIRIKYNQTKCMKWLKQKFDTIKLYLKSRNETKTGNGKSKVEGDNEEKLNYEAFELIAQYLDKSNADKLRKELMLTNPLDDNGNTNNKRSKPQEIISVE